MINAVWLGRVCCLKLTLVQLPHFDTRGLFSSVFLDLLEITDTEHSFAERPVSRIKLHKRPSYNGQTWTQDREFLEKQSPLYC